MAAAREIASAAEELQAPGTILIVCNSLWGVYNFRHGLVRGLRSRGHRVVVAAPPDRAREMFNAELGCELVPISVDRRGVRPDKEGALLAQLWRIYGEVAPDLVIHYTIKPVIYGSFVARARGIPCINMITGRGLAFSRPLLRRVVTQLYKLAFKGAPTLIFLHREDYATFSELGVIPPQARVRVIPGEGVDTDRFTYQPLPTTQGHFVFLYCGRLLWSKGLAELAEAARIVRERYSRARVQLLGFVDHPDSAAISTAALARWREEGSLEYLGDTDDVLPFLRQAHCIVLPSFYLEGTPRSLMEAAAVGRPVIATDMPGCSDLVADGETGFLVRPRDPVDLAEKMTAMMELPSEDWQAMAGAGRRAMVERFSQKEILSTLIGELERHLPENAGAK